MRRLAISGVAAMLLLVTAGHYALAQAVAQPTAGKVCSRRGQPRLTMNVPLQAPPANFPVPLPAGAKFIMGYEAKYATTRPTTVLRLRSNSEVKGLTRFYSAGFESQGWKATASSPSGKVSMSQVVASKPDLACLIQLTPASGGKEKGTDIMITLTHK